MRLPPQVTWVTGPWLAATSADAAARVLVRVSYGRAMSGRLVPSKRPAVEETSTSSATGRGARPRHVAGALCWLVQPLYVVVELLVAAGASSAYGLRDDTISALGALTCPPATSSSAVAAVCSPQHLAMNVAFVAFSLLRAVGALLLRDRLGPGRWPSVALWLWVVSGTFSAAVGFVPVDQHPSLHTIVAAPVFLTQPLAVLATALALRSADLRARGALAASGLVAGVVSMAGAVGFATRIGESTWVGLWERVALWPAYVWLGVVAVAMLAPSRSETVAKV